MPFETEQENFWAGEFGNEYIVRNKMSALVASNAAFLSKALSRTSGIRSCIEFGANIGLNLVAMNTIFPGIELAAIEINEAAVKRLRDFVPAENVFHGSILDFPLPPRFWDLVLIKGVLIHINPDCLPNVYEKLVSSCKKYLLVGEYYNPTPVSIPYRGHENKLFKRDFAGEIMESHPEMKLLDYGFIYRRDPNFPQDDMTWFLMEKS
ncbi:MAG: hypothetical protein LBF93_12845 [Zoogloeaceae bacterium]|jgi:spore coat polysaccharide biosynthesis protein SpsF|nr:hypothetical protein [Zoogloeaceae bacterium]